MGGLEVGLPMRISAFDALLGGFFQDEQDDLIECNQ